MLDELKKKVVEELEVNKNGCGAKCGAQVAFKGFFSNDVTLVKCNFLVIIKILTLKIILHAPLNSHCLCFVPKILNGPTK